MEVIDSEIAWNGSISGGVTDVNDAVTIYRNCIIHDNAGSRLFLHRQIPPRLRLIDLQPEKEPFTCTRKLISKKRKQNQIRMKRVSWLCISALLAGALLTGAVNERRLSHWAWQPLQVIERSDGRSVGLLHRGKAEE